MKYILIAEPEYNEDKQCKEIEFTEKELQYIADLDTFIYEDEEDSYYDDYLDEIQNKIRRVLE